MKASKIRLPQLIKNKISLTFLPFALIASLILVEIFRPNIVEFGKGESPLEKPPEFVLEGLNQKMRIGLVNMEKYQVEEIGIKGKFTVINFENISKKSNITWNDLFPNWIDEESESDCPKLPIPELSNIGELDVVIAQLPCGNVIRDVFRLHVHLVVANLAVNKGRRHGTRGVLKLIFMSMCEPMREIFRCDDLVKNEGRWWIYESEAVKLEERITSPVGSCQLFLPLIDVGNNKGFDLTKLKKFPHHSTQKEAYVTILINSASYVCGAITLAYSIRKTGSTRDLVLLHDDFLGPTHTSALRTAGWALRKIERIRNPNAHPGHVYEYHYSKLRIFELTDYDRVVYIDSDMIVLRNLDIIFSFPPISATGNHMEIFNSGVMVAEPSNCTFKNMMKAIVSLNSYDGSDQGFLNEFFIWWHRLPRRANFYKVMWSNTTEEKLLLDQLFAADPPQLYAIQYFKMRPWMCYRDYDCNWDLEHARWFVNDEAHWRWWRVYDEIDQSLKPMCKLSIEQKNNLERWRSEAKNKGYGDAHWNISILDPRRYE